MSSYLPSGVATVQLTGRYVDPQGLPLSGTVSFSPPPTVVLKDSHIIVSRTTTVTLDDQGSFTVSLLATDTVHTSPAGWAYAVTEKLTAPTPQIAPFIPPPPPTRTFYILLPSFPSVVDLADLAPAQPYSVSYLPVAGSAGAAGAAGPAGPQGPPGDVSMAQLNALAARVSTTEAAIVARPTPVTFSQASASSSWSFTHAFPYRPDVELYDSSGREIGAVVSFPTLTTVSVQFAAPETGSAILR